MSGASMFWRRLDADGHDCCRLRQEAEGWTVEGVALFLQGNDPVCLRYAFSCDAQWHAKGAGVSGWIGQTPVELTIDRSAAGAWRLNGAEQPVPPEVVDIDLGFTPATNILPVRRLALPIGSAARAPAAYLAFPDLKLDLLEQNYRRLDAARYAYATPRFGYEAVLDVFDTGFVSSYPGLWTADAAAGTPAPGP